MHHQSNSISMDTRFYVIFFMSVMHVPKKHKHTRYSPTYFSKILQNIWCQNSRVFCIIRPFLGCISALPGLINTLYNITMCKMFFIYLFSRSIDRFCPMCSFWFHCSQTNFHSRIATSMSKYTKVTVVINVFSGC